MSFLALKFKDDVLFSWRWSLGVWISLPILTVAALSMKKARALECFLTATACVAGVFAVFLITPHDLGSHWVTARSRVFSHLNEVLFFGVALVLGRSERPDAE